MEGALMGVKVNTVGMTGVLEPPAIGMVAGAKTDTLGVPLVLEPGAIGIVAEDLHSVVEEPHGDLSAQDPKFVEALALLGAAGIGAVCAPWRAMNEVGDRGSPGRGESCPDCASSDCTGRAVPGRSCALGAEPPAYMRNAGGGDPGVGHCGGRGDPGVGHCGARGDPGVGHGATRGDPGVKHCATRGEPGVGHCATPAGCTADSGVATIFGGCFKADAARTERLSTPQNTGASPARSPYGLLSRNGLPVRTGLSCLVGLCNAGPCLGEFRGELGIKPG